MSQIPGHAEDLLSFGVRNKVRPPIWPARSHMRSAPSVLAYSKGFQRRRLLDLFVVYPHFISKSVQISNVFMMKCKFFSFQCDYSFHDLSETSISFHLLNTLFLEDSAYDRYSKQCTCSYSPTYAQKFLF